MSKKIEIFSGTGGVGKTTLASSRALFLANQGKKILLITIDPSKRLKQVLGIDEQKSGEVLPVTWDFESADGHLDAMLMNPEKTIQRIGKLSHVDDFGNNKIVKVLARPNGGLNEILSIVELNIKINEHQYDTIILDTPPGSHFLDFLESSEKIESFFDKKFVEVFKFISNKDSVKSKGRIAFKLVSGGINKLISYLEKVTGASFIKDFVEAISVIYKTKEVFLKSIELKNKLKDTDYADWFLVTSTDQNKATEAVDLFKDATDFFGENSIILLNKCLNADIVEWQTSSSTEQELKENLQNKELFLKQTLTKHFKNIKTFEEIISNSPQEHIKQLQNQWN